jgi:hypothetical protein
MAAPPAAATAAADAQAGVWQAWVQDSLASLRARQLERILRPLAPTESPVEVCWVDLGG